MENSDLIKENERLKAELEKLNAKHSASEQNVKTLSDRNKSLKDALYGQVYNEKVKIVNSSKEKLDIYFKAEFENEVDRLTALEDGIRDRIHNMANALRRNNVELQDGMYEKLNELSMQVTTKVTEAQTRFARNHGAFSDNESEEFEKLKDEQITEEQILAVTKKNNVERFVGLNLLNIIGILLIIIGVITAARYTYMYIPDTLKSILMFALGAVMLLAGEIMNRRKPNIFSLGVTAGGVAVMYVALGVSYFGFKILDMYPALALCVLITAAAFFLSTRYNSQTVLTFALIGGYLPMFSISADKTMIYGAMVYFVMLNLLAFIVAFKKKWTFAAYIGLILNIIGTVYICLKFGYNSDLPQKFIVILYILFAFLNYTLIPIISTYINKTGFKKRDVVLLSINTFFSSLIMYLMFYIFGWDEFTGALAIIFAVIYLSLGWFIERKFEGEKGTRALFYLTGLAFVVLVVPFQFGRAWLTLGWLAEGVALTVYGILNDNKTFKKYGFIINALCLCAFLFFDVSGYIKNLFAYKYLAVTLGSLIILGAYMYKRTLSTGWQKFYKCAVIVNLWWYAVYISFKTGTLFEKMVHYRNLPNLIATLAIALTFIIAYTAPRIKILSDTGVKIISIIMYIFGILWLFGMNSRSFIYGEVPVHVTVAATAVLVIISLFSVLAMHDLIKLIVMERKLGVEWYPLIVSGYFVIILTQNLITRYNLSFASVWISIIYVLTALAWIIFGFAKRYSFIRKFGLGLALLSVVKLFLIDLSGLTQGYQIISYFSLGITLVAISFVYQYFNKRLELKMGGEDDVKENL